MAVPSNVVPLRKAQEHALVRRFGLACEDIRTRRGWSHDQMVTRSGLSGGMPSLIEAGKLTKLPLYTAWLMSQALEVPLDTLCALSPQADLDLSSYRLRLLLHAYGKLTAAAQELLVSTALELERVQQAVPCREA